MGRFEVRSMHSNRIVKNLEELRSFAIELSAKLGCGRVVALSGPLGSGKTTLVRELAVILGVPDSEVRSPSFTLVNVYQARRCVVYHVDLYRAKTEADIRSIDLEEILYDPAAMTFIEWPEQVLGRLPKDALLVNLDFCPKHGPDSRRLSLAPISTGKGPTPIPRVS
jgi:tRNA threonylcarbamoyl adenosine modification protein YjeE